MSEIKTLTELMSVEATSTPDVFLGKAESYGQLGIYGGHFLGQALAAGFETVEGPKVAQSFHSYFVKAGNPALPLEYHVTRVREGRGSDIRSISVVQDENVVFTMLASFKVSEGGEAHQKKAPVVPSAAEIVAAREAAGHQPFPFPMTLSGRVEMEWISDSFRPENYFPDRDPYLQLWMRVTNCGDASARTRQCLLAYLSDATLMFNSVLPYGVPFQTHRLTSLDQSTWFHRDTDPGEWLMYDQRSVAAADGRGLNEGEVYDRDGGLIMSTAQESMLRKIPGRDS